MIFFPIGNFVYCIYSCCMLSKHMQHLHRTMQMVLSEEVWKNVIAIIVIDYICAAIAPCLVLIFLNF